VVKVFVHPGVLENFFHLRDGSKCFLSVVHGAMRKEQESNLPQH